MARGGAADGDGEMRKENAREAPGKKGGRGRTKSYHAVPWGILWHDSRDARDGQDVQARGSWLVPLGRHFEEPSSWISPWSRDGAWPRCLSAKRLSLEAPHCARKAWRDFGCLSSLSSKSQAVGAIGACLPCVLSLFCFRASGSVHPRKARGSRGGPCRRALLPR